MAGLGEKTGDPANNFQAFLRGGGLSHWLLRPVNVWLTGLVISSPGQCYSPPCSSILVYQVAEIGTVVKRIDFGTAADAQGLPSVFSVGVSCGSLSHSPELLAPRHPGSACSEHAVKGFPSSLEKRNQTALGHLPYARRFAKHVHTNSSVNPHRCPARRTGVLTLGFWTRRWRLREVR